MEAVHGAKSQKALFFILSVVRALNFTKAILFYLENRLAILKKDGGYKECKASHICIKLTSIIYLIKKVL
jgi:hypothetical protein